MGLIIPQQQTLEEAFPNVDSGTLPLGSRVLVQIRTPKKVSRGGIIFADETKEAERWNAQIAKVIALGPLAFKSRESLVTWKEGEWCQPGQFVRVPKYGGDRWEVPINDDESALFALFDDLNILGLVTTDPLAIKAFI